jgi:hypothetical protein
MSEDRLVRMKDVKDAIRELFQFAPSHDEAVVVQRWIGETFFKVDDVFLALDGVPDAERVRPTAELSKSADPENVMEHSGICAELNDLYRLKNRDYGDSFHKTYLEEGMAMARIRLTDKLERFKKLTREGGRAVKDESIRDTLIDLANYAIMTVMEMDREAEENGCG